MQNYLPTDYQNFIALSRYARWKEDEQRKSFANKEAIMCVTQKTNALR